jgi:Protein of unknown function (DUF3500)
VPYFHRQSEAAFKQAHATLRATSRMGNSGEAMTISRRDILLTGAAIAAAPLLPHATFAAATDLGDAKQFRERVASFAAMLSPEESEAARFPFGGEVQANWNFMGAGGFIKPGFRLEQMSADQKTAAWDVLSAVLSPRGIEKTRDVMSLQQVLIEMSNSANARSPERYSFAIFGEPAADQVWALRLEGHHLSLTFLVGVTPSSFSVNPNRVNHGGSRNGLTTLKREDDLARKLAADLSGSAKERAFFMSEPFFRNVRALAGRETPFEAREGVAVADLATAQQDLLIEIVDAYTAEHLAAPFASAVTGRVQSGDAAAAHFAFAGATEIGKPAYYRIHGDHMLIEFACVDDAAQHLHTVFHLT